MEKPYLEKKIDPKIKGLVLKGTDAESPYEWIWDERTFGTHEIKVVAYDNEGNTAVDSQEVWIFNV